MYFSEKIICVIAVLRLHLRTKLVLLQPGYESRKKYRDNNTRFFVYINLSDSRSRNGKKQQQRLWVTGHTSCSIHRVTLF